MVKVVAMLLFLGASLEPENVPPGSACVTHELPVTCLSLLSWQ